jgi:hypothetical protein
MKNYKKVLEAIDKGEAPNLFHSDKERKYTPSLDIEKLMPLSFNKSNTGSLIMNSKVNQKAALLQKLLF